MSDNVTQLPGRITLDLDSAVKPEKDIKPPFVVNVAGRELTMSDPSDLDWRDLLLLETPTEFVRLSLPRDDYNFLLQQDLPGWKFNQLMDAYYQHYDLEAKVQEARRAQRLAGA